MSDPVIITKTIEETSVRKFAASILWISRDFPYLKLQNAYFREGDQITLVAEFRGEFIQTN